MALYTEKHAKPQRLILASDTHMSGSLRASYSEMENHELFDILDCIPNWQIRFATLRDAAEYAKALPEYYDYMHTDEGMRRRLQFETVPDTMAYNRAERRMRERMARLPSRANPNVQDELDAEDGEDE